MGYLHTTIAFGNGGLQGIQACQRDWTKYLVHFTCARAMEPLKKYPSKKQISPEELVKQLGDADDESLKTVKSIQKSMILKASSPSPDNMIEPCICFSECNLPGLINHCERYGRFGFVFKKETVFNLGGRPAIYLDRSMYTNLAKTFRNATDTEGRRLFSLLNVFSPSGNGEIQDFTLEREWRLFSDLPLRTNIPDAILCPLKYYNVISPLFGSITIPIDLLAEWGL